MIHDRVQKVFSKRIRAAVLPLFAFAAWCFYSACAVTTTPDAPATASETAYKPVFVRPPRFLTDVCLTRTGELWVTAEAGGVYRLTDPDTQREWEDMRALPGFPKTDNCTAVCEDS